MEIAGGLLMMLMNNLNNLLWHRIYSNVTGHDFNSPPYV